MPRPKHPKSDSNAADQNAILRQCGLVVVDVSALAGEQVDDDTDTQDVFVGDPLTHQWLHVEWKTEEGTLTPRQRRYQDRYGKQLPIRMAWRAEEVLRALGRIP